MEYTKGKWVKEGNRVKVSGAGTVAICPSPTDNEGVLEFVANAKLIAAVPDYHELIKDMIAFNVLSPTHSRGLYARAKRIQAKVAGK